MFINSSSSKYINLILCAANHLGANKDLLLSKLDIDCNVLTNPDTRISNKLVVDLFELAMDFTVNPSLGVCVGQLFKPSSFGSLGVLLMSSATLYDAVVYSIRYQPLVQGLGLTNLEVNENVAALVWKSRYLSDEKIQPFSEATLFGYVYFARSITMMKNLVIDFIEFRHKKPYGRQDYEKILGCPIIFSSNRNALVFKTSVLNIPLPQANSELVDLLLIKFGLKLDNLVRSDGQNSFSVFVRNYLSDFFISYNYGPPSMDQVSAYFNYSPRTFRRRLRNENTSYTEILNQERKIKSEYLLKNTNLNINEVSLILGYSTQASFCSAFKKWNNKNPFKYRLESGITQKRDQKQRFC